VNVPGDLLSVPDVKMYSLGKWVLMY